MLDVRSNVKKVLSYILFVLFAVWLLMAVIKIIMAFNGATDPVNDRGPSDFFISGAVQLLLAGAAFYGARKLRSASARKNRSVSEMPK